MKKFCVLFVFFSVLMTHKLQAAENNSLLTPNVTPGNPAVGDITRTKQYFDSLERLSRKPQKVEPTSVEIEDEIKLPPRTIQNAPEIYIKKVELSESKIFTAQELAKIKALIEGKNVTAEDLNNIVNLINSLYLKKKFLTAKGYLPEDALKDGVLKINLIEAKLGKVIIEDNEYTRDFFIKAFLTQKKGDVLDLVTLEENLKQFNQNARGVVLRAKLKPGEEKGTTDVVIVTEEQMPVHLSGSVDNFGSKSTGEVRYGGVISSDSVIGFQDRASLGSMWSSSSQSTYADYNAPINTKDTRLGVSYMYGDSDITKGPYRDFEIDSKTKTTSVYLSHPFLRDTRSELKGVVSLNQKNNKSNIYGYTYSRMEDMNVAMGVNYQYRWDDAYVYTSHMITNGNIKDKMFDSNQYFFKYNADIYAVKYYQNGIALSGKFLGQYVPQDTPFIEQGQVGGMSTVRGYEESLLMGHSSYVASLEALFPLPFLPAEDQHIFTYKNQKGECQDVYYNFRNNIKWAAFVDTGGVYRHGFTSTSKDYITGVGTGVRVSITSGIQARLYWGYAVNHDKLDVPDSRFHFEVVSAFF